MSDEGEAPMWLLELIRSRPHELQRRLKADPTLIQQYPYYYNTVDLAESVLLSDYPAKTLSILVEAGAYVPYRVLRGCIENAAERGFECYNMRPMITKLARTETPKSRITLLEGAFSHCYEHVAHALVRAGADPSRLVSWNGFSYKRDGLRRQLLTYHVELTQQRAAIVTLIGLRRLKRRCLLLAVPMQLVEFMARECWAQVE
jgi:hypothetical protein